MNQSQANVTVKDEFCVELRPDPCAMIIFGASGDLTNRKLIPALYNLSKRSLLPEDFFVIGCARSQMNEDEFRKKACDSISEKIKDASKEDVEKFCQTFFYIRGDYNDHKLYSDIKDKLASLYGVFDFKTNHIFYMATPPNLYNDIVSSLSSEGLIDSCPHGIPCSRVVVEKPFGQDLESAKSLDRKLNESLTENQIYRIDHYLGKETVQNILMFRFANSIFEPVWNREYIDNVQITVAESIGVEHRAGYYDKAGALRDMFQNHMFQMLALVAMEAPSSFDADRVRNEKVALMRAIKHFSDESIVNSIVRGQYTSGEIDGHTVKGYREEEGVETGSLTETYVAAKFIIDNQRWKGVPFYLRSGKRLPKRVSEITINFKRLPHSIFDPIKPEDLSPNQLILNVQPDEGIELAIQAKHPGPKLCMSTLTMDFKYKDIFAEDLPDAYERLLLDCMLGDQMLFNRSDGMELSWALFTPVLERWESSKIKPYPYASGSWGPKEADDMIKRDGYSWREL